MLEEAMAQLMANQEKIASSEGKGPTWEDKVSRNARSHKIHFGKITMHCL